MANEITAKQKQIAKSLLEKHKEEKIFINTRTGHMSFKENIAKTAEKEPEEVQVFDGKFFKVAFPKKDESGSKGSEDDKNEVVIPEGEPSKEWTKDQLIAFGLKEFPDLKLTKSMKEDTLLTHLAEAKAGQSKED